MNVLIRRFVHAQCRSGEPAARSRPLLCGDGPLSRADQGRSPTANEVNPPHIKFVLHPKGTAYAGWRARTVQPASNRARSGGRPPLAKRTHLSPIHSPPLGAPTTSRHPVRSARESANEEKEMTRPQQPERALFGAGGMRSLRRARHGLVLPVLV
jgi:hypothetical protein